MLPETMFFDIFIHSFYFIGMQKVKVKTRMVAISAALTAKAERMTMMARTMMRRARTARMMMRMIRDSGNERNSNRNSSSKWRLSSKLGSKSISRMCNLRNWTRMDKKKMTVMTISQQPNLIGEAERITKVVRKVDLRVARQASNSKEDDNNRMTLTMTSTTVRTTNHSNNNNNKGSRSKRTSSSRATCRICRHK